MKNKGLLALSVFTLLAFSLAAQGYTNSLRNNELKQEILLPEVFSVENRFSATPIFVLPEIDPNFKSNALQILKAYQKRLYLLGGNILWSIDSKGIARSELDHAGYGYGAEVIDGNLYLPGSVAAGNGSLAIIYRIKSDYSIEKVFEAPTVNNPVEFFAFAKYGDYIYAGAYMSPDGVTMQGSLWRSSTGNLGTWSEFKRWNTNENKIVRAMRAWNGYLWIGGGLGNAAPLIRFDGSTFVTLFSTDLNEIRTIEQYEDALWFAGGKGTGIGRLYRTDGIIFTTELIMYIDVYKLRPAFGKLLICGGEKGWDTLEWCGRGFGVLSARVFEYDGRLKIFGNYPEGLIQTIEVFNGKLYVATTGYGILFEQFPSLDKEESWEPWWADNFNDVPLKWQGLTSGAGGNVERNIAVAMEGTASIALTTGNTTGDWTVARILRLGQPESKRIKFSWFFQLPLDTRTTELEFGFGDGTRGVRGAVRYDAVARKWVCIDAMGVITDIPNGAQILEAGAYTWHYAELIVNFAARKYERLRVDYKVMDMRRLSMCDVTSSAFGFYNIKFNIITNNATNITLYVDDFKLEYA